MLSGVLQLFCSYFSVSIWGESNNITEAQVGPQNLPWMEHPIECFDSTRPDKPGMAAGWFLRHSHCGGPWQSYDRDCDGAFLCLSVCPLWAGGHGKGYEKYNSMRADPALCFLERVGMPDAKAIAAEQRGADMLADGGDG